MKQILTNNNHMLIELWLYFACINQPANKPQLFAYLKFKYMKNSNEKQTPKDPISPENPVNYVPIITSQPAEHPSERMRLISAYETQIADLQEKLESSCRRQHEIENILEEYEVAKNRQAHQAKEINKRFYDLQKKYAAADKERKEFSHKVTLLEKEKKSVTERWVRAASQAKQDDKQKGTNDVKKN